jgi:hypothetical protein
MPKFSIDTDQVHTYLVRQLESWVASMPKAAQNEPFVTTADGDLNLSPREILQHVEKGTDLGEKLMEHAAALAMADSIISNS